MANAKIKTTIEPNLMPSRRATLIGATAALATGAVAARASAVVGAAASPARAEIDALLEKRIAHYRQEHAIDREYSAAQVSMPWWAQPGPKYLRGDGEWAGDVVEWPAIIDDRRPKVAYHMICKRPSPDDILNDFKSNVHLWGEKKRPEIRARYRQRMRDLVERLRHQREEEQKALAEIAARWDLLIERIDAVNHRLRSMEVDAVDVPQKTAALIIFYEAAINYTRGDDRVGFSYALPALLPALTGSVRTCAEQVMAHERKTVGTLPFLIAA